MTKKLSKQPPVRKLKRWVKFYMRRPTSEEIVNDGLETMISTIAGFTLGLGIVG